MPDGTSRFTDAEGKEIKRLGVCDTFGLVVAQGLLHGLSFFLGGGFDCLPERSFKLMYFNLLFVMLQDGNNHHNRLSLRGAAV